MKPGSSGFRRKGYDEMIRLDVETDGDQGRWRGSYDLFGQLIFEELPVAGSFIIRSFDDVGAPISEVLSTSAGELPAL